MIFTERHLFYIADLFNEFNLLTEWDLFSESDSFSEYRSKAEHPETALRSGGFLRMIIIITLDCPQRSSDWRYSYFPWLFSIILGHYP